jgi:hypothetical protein
MGFVAAATSASAFCCPLPEVAAEVALLELVLAELVLLEDEQLANTEQIANTARETIRYRFAEAMRILLSPDSASLSFKRT